MSKLSITLSGVIETSNFDEWKTELVEQIRSVKSELTTDDDFAQASKHVKQFKAAEKNLKEAKKSALKQAEEINQLFEAIDQVSAEARQARLNLDKQIKKRKKEIKKEFIQQGVETINAFIKEQSEAFQSISLGSYNDEAIFADAVSGKASAKGMQKAITKSCESIKAAIIKKAGEVEANVAILDKLPGSHQALFQDQAQLISLATDELNTIIDQRIATFDGAVKDSDDLADKDLANNDAANKAASEQAEKAASTASINTETKSAFIITVELNASEQEADDIRSKIVKTLAGETAVGVITLAAR